MGNEPTSGRKLTRVGVSLQVQVASRDVDDFVQHFAANISRGGMFIQCKQPKPEGTVLLFEIRLKEGKAVIRGKGEVVWTRAWNPDEQQTRPPGMGVKFLALDKPSKAVVKRILEIKTGKKTVEGQPAPPVASLPEREEPGIDPGDFDVDVEPAEEERAGEIDDIDVDIDMDDFADPVPVEDPDEVPAGDVALPEGTGDAPIVGIDLGTTYSCAAVVIDGKAQIVASRKGHRTMPSVVAYTDDGRLLVGHPAREQMELNPQNTVYGSKRLIGRHFDSPAVSQMKDRFHYEIIEGKNREAAVRMLGRDLSLQQVSALILKEFRELATEMLGKPVASAVVSVPAYYNENQRQAVREAGKLAGLAVERIVNEPTAAALAYGYKKGLDKRVLVYDLGGGTFDAALLDLYENMYEVVATGGDLFLGGVDFDNQLLDHVLFEFSSQAGAVPELDRAAMQRLRFAVELAKCTLSEKDETSVRLPYFAVANGQPVDLDVPVSRTALEMLTAPLVERSMEVVNGIMKKAGLRLEQLDEILLVGGQTRMPFIRRRLERAFRKEPFKGVHPDEAVAVGAALLADSLGKIDSVLLIDALAVSIGYGTIGGGFRQVLISGNALPSNVSLMVRTHQENQQTLELLLFQGESDRILNNEYLGTATITDITPAPRGKVQLKLTFNLDVEGLLSLTCSEVASGKENPVTVAMRHGETDIRERLKIPEDEKATDQVGVPESLRKAR